MIGPENASSYVSIISSNNEVIYTKQCVLMPNGNDKQQLYGVLSMRSKVVVMALATALLATHS